MHFLVRLRMKNLQAAHTDHYVWLGCLRSLHDVSSLAFTFRSGGLGAVPVEATQSTGHVEMADTSSNTACVSTHRAASKCVLSRVPTVSNAFFNFHVFHQRWKRTYLPGVDVFCGALFCGALGPCMPAPVPWSLHPWTKGTEDLERPLHCSANDDRTSRPRWLVMASGCEHVS